MTMETSIYVLYEQWNWPWQDFPRGKAIQISQLRRCFRSTLHRRVAVHWNGRLVGTFWPGARGVFFFVSRLDGVSPRKWCNKNCPRTGVYRWLRLAKLVGLKLQHVWWEIYRASFHNGFDQKTAFTQLIGLAHFLSGYGYIPPQKNGDIWWFTPRNHEWFIIFGESHRVGRSS